NRKVPFGSDLALPIQDAVQNKEGSGISVDYRGIPIIAVWRYIPGPNWGIVVKADKDEIFHSVNIMRNRFIITGLILILVAISIAIYLSRSISNPIKKLQSGIEKISQGNLKYKVGNDAPDEIGQLSRSFDEMTARLETITASRNELNKEIRQRKEAQKEIRLLSKALEMNPSTVIITDREGVIIYVNRKFTLETGFSFDEVVGQKPQIIKSGTHPDSFYKELWDTILSGQEWNSEMQNKRKNGELFWHSVSISPIFIDSGEITHFVSNQVNITERKELVENLKNKTDNLEKSRMAAFNMMQDAEEQRQKTESALNKLKESHEEVSKLSLAIEQSPVTVGITDVEGNIEWVNKTFTKVTGYTSEEVIGKNPRIFKSGKHPKSFYKNLWETILSGQTWRGEFINKIKNGDLIWDSATISPLKNEEGLITHFIAIKEVITDRKKAEEALRKSEDQIRLLLNSTAEGIYGIDLDGNCTFSNKSCLQLLGYERSDQLSGKDMHQLIHHTYADGTPFPVEDCAIFKAKQTGEGTHINDEVLWRADGTSFDAEYWSFPIINDGKITGAVVTFIDITDRKVIENELILSQDILRNSSDCLYVYDQTSRQILDVNETSCNKMGYSREELLTLRIDDINPKFPMDQWDAVMAEIKASKDGFLLETRHQRKDGTSIPVETSVRYVNLANKDILVSTARDITERLKGDAEIKQAKTEAEKANLAKSEFLSRMSHELRTPLNSILGFAQLMEMGELNPKHKKGVKQIMNSGKHLLDLINEVLDLSRIEAGQLSLTLESVELSGIISESIDIVRPLAAGSNLKLKTKDSLTNDLYVKADRQRLKQVLLNLINNAIKYNREGGSVSVHVSRPTSHVLRINVTDTGIGISPEGIQKLFNPFQRIGSDISEIEGTGLGLAVAKKLMEAMHGTIGVESEAGEGSTFWIELPLCKSIKERPRSSGDATKQEAATIRKTGTILYIEDNVSNIQLVENIIGEHRQAVHLVTDIYGRNAVKLAIDHKPDFILLDLDLPDIHGIEVLKLVKANKKTKAIPVVILSADATPSQIEKMLTAGAKTYLTKPLDVVKFLKLVDEMLNKKQT
ncbi:PAS domain S-box protein, partial [bacterium]|nr:PAS domain S-box protein [bacterium]